jgi:hypothetical protein
MCSATCKLIKIVISAEKDHHEPVFFMDKFSPFLDQNLRIFWNSFPSVKLAKFVKTLPKLPQTKKNPKKHCMEVLK